ncbi:MAG: alpha/beta hydrolase [bacterium]|nr:alpha/beta hydrolase [bacterium]
MMPSPTLDLHSPVRSAGETAGGEAFGLDAWRRRGAFVPVSDRQVFFVDEGPHDAEPLLILHGSPTSSFDFHRVLGALTEKHRVVAHDHFGFGLSAKPKLYSYSLLEQADTALELWRQLGIRSGHLLAHDYGTSVATELLARRERGLLPIALKSVTLCNGSVHLELARLRISQRIARSRVLGPLFGRLVFRAYFKRVMRRLWGDRRKADDGDLDSMWQGVRSHQGHLRTHQISSYLNERMRFRHRWIGALVRLDLPTHVLWGRRDPVAVAAIAEKLAEETPDAVLTWLDDAGHYPMLEDPQGWSEAALSFLARVEEGSAP